MQPRGLTDAITDHISIILSIVRGPQLDGLKRLVDMLVERTAAKEPRLRFLFQCLLVGFSAETSIKELSAHKSLVANDAKWLLLLFDVKALHDGHIAEAKSATQRRQGCFSW